MHLFSLTKIFRWFSLQITIKRTQKIKFKVQYPSVYALPMMSSHNLFSVKRINHFSIERYHPATTPTPIFKAELWTMNIPFMDTRLATSSTLEKPLWRARSNQRERSTWANTFLKQKNQLLANYCLGSHKNCPLCCC